MKLNYYQKQILLWNNNQKLINCQKNLKIKKKSMVKLLNKKMKLFKIQKINIMIKTIKKIKKYYKKKL